MSRIPDHIIDQVREQANIVQIIGEHVQLKKAGRNYLGLCPFHNERTPSFNVNAERGMFKCFGCGKGGNVITFLQEHQHLSFPDAVRQLATRLNIVIPEETIDDPTGMQARREEARAALREAARLYTDILHSSDGAPARRFLSSRGFDDRTIEAFGIGAAPAAWDATMKHLLANGFTDQHLDDAGLVVRTDEGKVYDRFRGRLMFPIRDDAGRVVGFSARVITATSDAPKYINSPQTIVYDKSRVLYGLDLAKRAIMQARSAYVVEGQADVIAMHQAGFTATVASSGTALTPEQLRSLTRYADRVVLVFDADAAGQKAMSRGIEIALQAGLDVQCVVLPEGEDPDSMIQQHGTEAMQELLDAALPWMTYQMERFRLMGDLEDAVRKAQAVRTMLGWIGGIPDELRRPFLIQELATAFELDASLLTPIVPTPIAPTTPQPTTQSAVQRQTQPAAPQPQVLQLLPSELELLRIALAVDHGLALMVHQFDMTAESFATARGQSLFHHILLAEHETHSIIDYIQAHPTLPQQDKDLLQSISSSVVVLSTKWKEFDVDLPTHNTARSIADALLSIAIHRKTEEMQTLLTAEGSAEGDARLDLQRKMHAVATVIEELRKRRYSPSSNSTPDLTWLDVNSTSAS